MFYRREESLLRRILLSPLWVLSLLYRCAVDLRMVLYDAGVLRSRSLPVPVLCVGNITVGGTGKTPLIMALSVILGRAGVRVGVVSRGYGRSTRGCAVVSDGRTVLLGPEEAGDEPVLLARSLPGVPVAVGEERSLAGSLLLAADPVDAVLLDDGFSHLGLKRDVDVLVFKAALGVGNGHLLPRGPLREPLRGLGRASAFVLVGEEGEGAGIKEFLGRRHPGTPVFEACWRLTGFLQDGVGRPRAPKDLEASTLLTVCGIGDPGSLPSLLRSYGLTVRGEMVYPDHYWYTEKDIRDIIAMKEKNRADAVVTTEKDYVRLGRLPSRGLPVFVAKTELDVDARLGAFVLSRVRR